MGNRKIPDNRDDIEETILPDNDGKKEESVQSTVTPDSDNGTDNTEVVNEKVSRKSFAAVVTGRIFELRIYFQSLRFMLHTAQSFCGSIRHCSGTL